MHDLPAASLSRHPSADEPVKSVDNDNSDTTDPVDSATAAAPSTAPSKKRDRETGSNILQRYSVTAVSVSQEGSTTAAHKKLKPAGDVPVVAKDSTGSEEYLSLTC